MSNETTTTTAPAQTAQVQIAETPKKQIGFGSAGVSLASLEEAYRFASAVIKSGFAPKGYETPESVLIAIQMGAEIGLAPMQALQNIAVINGRPAVWGDAASALVYASGKLDYMIDSITGEGDARICTVSVCRKGGKEVSRSFSVADAKRAGLWGKAGPWSTYPDRMLLARARAFALRDAFSDVLKGVAIAEEVRDLEINVTPKAEKKGLLA